jgi:hypothetical protein
MPTRIGPSPGAPVIDISPPMRDVIEAWTLVIEPSWLKPEMLP